MPSLSPPRPGLFVASGKLVDASVSKEGDGGISGLTPHASPGGLGGTRPFCSLPCLPSLGRTKLSRPGGWRCSLTNSYRCKIQPVEYNTGYKQCSKELPWCCRVAEKGPNAPIEFLRFKNIALFLTKGQEQ